MILLAENVKNAKVGLCFLSTRLYLKTKMCEREFVRVSISESSTLLIVVSPFRKRNYKT